MGKKKQEEIIKIPEILLEWSDWYSWNEIMEDGRKRDSVKIPNKKGVYEVKKREGQR